jgi:predicted phage terminase large subunit-like protein
MNESIAPKVYGTNLQAFVEKAFRSSEGNKLSSTQLYINFIVCYLERFLQGDIKKLLVNLPGRHLKTFICSVCLPAFMLGNDPTLKFLIVAHNEELAEDIVRQIREIMQSAWYKKVFNTRLDERHSKKTDFKVVGGGRVRAAPVGSVTGKGGDVVIFDDPHNVHDWDNYRKKLKVVQAFELLVSRRDGGKMSRMLVVGHRVAEDDLSAHILERDDFEHVCLPLFAPKDMSFDIGHATWHLAKGEALRPDEYPPDEIESLRLHHQGTPFWLYYQQGFGPKKDDFIIEVSHFPFIERQSQGNAIARGAQVVLSVDPAQKTESGSRNVIHVYAVRGNHYDFLQASAEKCSSARLARRVRYYAQRYGASLILIENTARGPDLIDELRQDMAVKIMPVNPRGTKAARLRKCTPIIRAKRVRLKRNRPEVEAAVDEILSYPNSAYDDHVDTMTNFLLEAVKFTAETFVNAPRVQTTSVALVTSRNVRTVPSSIQGISNVRARSIFRPAQLPDFSNGRAEPDRRPDGRSRYAAEGSSEPIYAFDGKKMVRIK